MPLFGLASLHPAGRWRIRDRAKNKTIVCCQKIKKPLKIKQI
jgi:hypothetical protein